MTKVNIEFAVYIYLYTMFCLFFVLIKWLIFVNEIGQEQEMLLPLKLKNKRQNWMTYHRRSRSTYYGIPALEDKITLIHM